MNAANSTIRSMTGFAEARTEENGWRLRVSIRSVNHRFLDPHIRVPLGLERLEPQIRQALRDRLRRGHVEVTVHAESTGLAAVRVNEEVAEAYVKAAESLRRRFELNAEPDLVSLFRLPGVVDESTEPDSEQEETIARAVDACLAQGLTHLDEMRAAEGRTLAAEMRGLLRGITVCATRVEELIARSLPAYAERLTARLTDLLGGTAIDPARIAQEAAILAERGDTSEELSRLRSHVEQFEAALDSGGELGKKLDFLLQEMQREANTLLSKSPGVESEGLAVTGLGLEIKSHIEKLREQVQNVE
ncbi:MAG TPA: YicC/YloC family endoribonuclease [Methylomirabilota bacterium]|nr:YicC/YloC family endoribonuclease [Methylomirabilota bacterium]